MKLDWLVIRSEAISFRIDRRVPLMLLCLAVAVMVAMVMNLGRGEYPISPLDIVKTLLGIDTSNPDHGFVIYNLRLPRTLVAFMVGMALAISGTIFQGIARNPLADPGIIGINAGASLAAVAVIVLFPSTPIYTLPLSAFVGALLMAGLIYSLAWNNGSSPVLFILMGVGLSAIASAFTSLLITFGDIYSVSDALVWLAGSVYGRTWEQVFSFLPWLIIFIPMAMILARHLNVLNLGDDVAKGLGTRVEWQRGLLVLVGVALAGAAVATAGMIGFVGLITPHLGRQLVGTNHQGLIPTSALLGGMLVVASDFFGRTIFAPIEIPCGVVTAAIGAPYFLYLLIRNRKK
ncbi:MULTISPECIES: FecCD family ABC transporter permease [unclassified Tolypothrix]|uniref:FecCD family ABC transporter permease n=1 Tax=unclassified Tolypothrix TaxID=2649714 RepID=UPI0005EABB7C|nr:MULTISPECIES: iron ABC transporter permease [unclassified Tolypothrix]BAY91123.1 iron(III) dicitrate transport system permease protein [Microchaete diplosiphon NIES-3275]EKE99949.1 putative ferrichrome transport system permease protein FhuG [Tolypothrix sp. PCC 7601]MBE9081431.1 iron ABC transporter permease [Tolypothrix sp. LEGE 11397]UYD25218.1 iron ABC transporter permease [Tolypothrix sp. PCC 7712]UYD32543.1 iron ABC transporter permease [Tolypothrix sp. PCC 7601]